MKSHKKKAAKRWESKSWALKKNLMPVNSDNITQVTSLYSIRYKNINHNPFEFAK